MDIFWLGAALPEGTQTDTLRQRIAGSSPFEATIGFSRAIRVGTLVFVSGTAPIWPDGAVDADPARQAQRCWDLVDAALETAGARLDQVVRTRMFITDRALAEPVGAVHGQVFGRIRPAATMVVVAGLLDPRWVVEVEADAIIGEAPPAS